MVRERVQHHSVQSMKDFDSFFEKGEPRRIDDWKSDRTLKPINSSLFHLMKEAGIDRIDKVLKPALLHSKLRNVEFQLIEFKGYDWQKFQP